MISTIIGKGDIYMKKKLGFLFGIMIFVFLCMPYHNAAAAGYAEDSETGEAVNALETYVVSTGSEEQLDTIKSYRVILPVDTDKVVLPITFEEKGVFVCSAELPEGTSDSVYLDFGIYSDEGCTDEVYYSSYSKTAAIEEKGTYYLKFSISDYSDSKPTDFYTIGFASQFYQGNDRTLSNKKWTCSGIVDTQKPIYYKVKVDKAGYLTINMESEYSNYVTLLDSKKKVISEKVYSYDGEKVVFAVEKGTYYLEISGSSDLHRIMSTFTSVTDGSGSSKSKAKKMTAGKTYTGYLSATNKKGTVDWYKITLPKSQEVEIIFKGSVSSGTIDLEFYGNEISGSITAYISYVDSDKSFTAKTWTSSKLPKGTYYIKVSKDTTETSGFYKLQLKK
jgi:hypothetical protein